MALLSIRNIAFCAANGTFDIQGFQASFSGRFNFLVVAFFWYL